MTEPPPDSVDEGHAIESDAPKQRTDPTSAAELIAQAYTRKGQASAVSAKSLAAAGKEADISDDDRCRLNDFADTDVLLAVPRRIVTVAGMTSRHTNLFRTLMSFVRDVLRKHPIFASEDLAEVFGRAPGSQGLIVALELIERSDLSKIQDPKTGKPLTSKQQLDLRINAAYSLTIWLALQDELSVESVSAALFATIWRPASLQVREEFERIKRLTDSRDLATVGIACATFQSETGKHMRLAQEARESETAAIERADQLQGALDRAREDLASILTQVHELERKLAEQRQIHEVAISHLGDDLEQLRARVVRRLREETELLREGLLALRRDPPVTKVTDDHVERAIKGLEDALRNLEART